MFYLCTVFPNITTEEERYYITDVLKKSKCISVQFVQSIEKLNSYIAQLPCWFYSPSAKPSTIPMNVLFAEAVLVSHILRMCPHIWQYHFNLHKKGMTPVDMHLLLMSLEAIECVCTQEKSNAQSNKKASQKGTRGNKRPGAESTTRVPKKACTKKHCNLCKKHGDACTMHNRKDCPRYEKDRTENSISSPSRTAKRNQILQSSLSHN
jgi:hypothetical protein